MARTGLKDDFEKFGQAIDDMRSRTREALAEALGESPEDLEASPEDHPSPDLDDLEVDSE
ncbi:MAG: hypothetical protein MAG715_01294 [Methanonatronarchaeales archaeon]|nr:hypothetical protein [Methanonatronarchaeales archaeon]